MEYSKLFATGAAGYTGATGSTGPKGSTGCKGSSTGDTILGIPAR